MGLGLHGGGLASALFFAAQGAAVTVTDLRNESDLAESLEKLKSFPIRFALGGHKEEDFINTDLVIKNPGVRADSPYLSIARAHNINIETDISLFLLFCSNPVIAVTGSKGKSTVASALYEGLVPSYPGTKLGGNITLSPLSFLAELLPDAPVVLELSSWQLADLAGNACLKPKVSIITNILPDHMNRYRNMEEYVMDKKIIYSRQDKSDFSIFNFDDPYSAQFSAEAKAHQLFFSKQKLPEHLEGGWLADGKCILRFGGLTAPVLDRPLKLPGEHNRQNLLSAAVALEALGLEPEAITERLSGFSGIEHRLELFLEKKGVRFINDSAATIPHAVVEALKALAGPVILICGGTDKNIDFTPFAEAAAIPREIILLEGSATEKMMRLLGAMDVGFRGPFSTLEEAVREALLRARSKDSILFSPGCASFGMFQNEFDRGRQFKKLISNLS
jgi:UDP-N-acetylmuramoylalanine--D-glutamate ligase